MVCSWSRCSRWCSPSVRSTSRPITVWRRGTGWTSSPRSATVTASGWPPSIPRHTSTGTGCAAACPLTLPRAARHALGQYHPHTHITVTASHTLVPPPHTHHCYPSRRSVPPPQTHHYYPLTHISTTPSHTLVRSSINITATPSHKSLPPQCVCVYVCVCVCPGVYQTTSSWMWMETVRRRESTLCSAATWASWSRCKVPVCLCLYVCIF